MKSRRLPPVFAWLVGATIAIQAQTITLIRQFGGPSDDYARGVAVDSGGVYLAGSVLGALPGQSGAGGRDAYARKYDFGGNEQWTGQFGSSSEDEGAEVAINATGVFVVGRVPAALPTQIHFGSIDAFVRKYDSNGMELWTRQFGSAGGDGGDAVAADATAVYVTGITTGTLPGQVSAGGGGDAYVRKYDNDGNALWTRQFGTPAYEEAFGVAVVASGVYVAGHTQGSMPGATNAGAFDGFVRKYDLDGNLLWTRQFGSNLTEFVWALAADATGAYAVGYTFGTLPGQTNAGGVNDVIIVKYATNGDELWTRQFGTSGTDEGLTVAVGASAVYVGGRTGGTFPGQTSGGGTDAFARKYDSNGNELWTRQFGGGAGDEVLHVTPFGSNVYVAGVTSGTLPGQTHFGGLDSYLAKITDPSGPMISSLAATPNPVAVGVGVTLTAIADDSTTGGANIVSAEYTLDGGMPAAMSASDGFYDSPTELLTAAVAPFTSAGIHDVCVAAMDGEGLTSQPGCIKLVAYDPDGGFVTGGGHVQSPAGADLANLDASGRAHFGFVSKYKQGASVPTGSLQFQFQAGNLNFHSTLLEWLVVTGQPRAIFRGQGMINGSIECKFEVDAWDASFGSGLVDAFGLKIYACSNSPERYRLDPTPLGGGNVMIHR